MSAPASPRAALEALMLRAASDEKAAEVQALSDALDAFDDLARQVTISQHAATVTQLAHEWAEARRARYSLQEPPYLACEDPTAETAYERGGPCYDYSYGRPTDVEITRMCPTCRAAAGFVVAKARAAAKLSGLSARLERTCLGPRPKKEAPTC